MRRLASLLLLWSALQANAAVDTLQFKDETERQRYLYFTRELRCPKCQNQNLADSAAPIAADLRHEVYRLLQEGRSDAEVVDFMVTRYGEYVLYKPPLDHKTWLLWGAPVALLGLGFLVIWRMQVRGRRVRARLTAEPSAAELDALEQRRLRELLKDSAAP